VDAVPTSAKPTAPPNDSSAPTATAASAQGDHLRLVTAPDGNAARYLVTEQLADQPFPSDAVGETSDVSGVIVLGADGAVVSDGSRFEVDLRTLQSDSSRRDNFIQGNTLQTSTYPLAEFVPTEAIGLPIPLPTGGEVAFQLAGDLTLHGVTRPATWDVSARVEGQSLIGTARTSVTFTDFGMTAPRVFVVLSVDETIRLEFDFHLALES
jgi:polyisoprenoid-binding protein YceI